MFTVGAGASTAAQPGGPYLYIPTGSQYWTLSGASGTWNKYPSAAAHFQYVNSQLWCVFYDAVNKVWKIQNSSDGSTFAPPNVYNPVANGTPTVHDVAPEL